MLAAFAQWFDGFTSPVTSTPMSFSSVVFPRVFPSMVFLPSCWPMCITLHIGHCRLWWFASFWRIRMIIRFNCGSVSFTLRHWMSLQTDWQGLSPGIMPDPYVFGPPWSSFGSVIYLYGPGSGSFHQQAKKEAMISTLLWLLYDLKAWKLICLRFEPEPDPLIKCTDPRIRIRIRIRTTNVTDAEHSFYLCKLLRPHGMWFSTSHSFFVKF